MWTLFTPMHELDRLLSDRWTADTAPTWFESFHQREGFEPRVDIEETGETYRFEVDLPGVDPGNVNVTLENNVLSVTGKRIIAHEDHTERQHRLERAGGQFERSFELPEAVIADAVTATSKNGVLTVLVPKKQPERKAIPITTAS